MEAKNTATRQGCTTLLWQNQVSKLLLCDAMSVNVMFFIYYPKNGPAQ